VGSAALAARKEAGLKLGFYTNREPLDVDGVFDAEDVNGEMEAVASVPAQAAMG